MRFLPGGCLTSAAASEYRDDVQSGRIVFATGFETAAEQEMKLPQCYSIGRFGRNGSHCLKVERRNPKAYTLKGFRVSVVPGKNYLLEFYARSGNLRRNSSSSGAAPELPDSNTTVPTENGSPENIFIWECRGRNGGNIR